MRITWLDPGGMTGIAIYESNRAPEFQHEAFAVPEDEAMDWLRTALSTELAGEVVGFESIVITQGTAKKSQDVQSSIRQIGCGRHMCRWAGVQYVEQNPSDRKFCTDAKLRALGWWTKGLDHPREATRHLVTWLAENDESFRADLAAKLR